MKKRFKLRVLYFLFPALAVIACNESEKIPEVLNLVPETATLGALDTEVSAKVECDLKHWTVELEDPTWGEVEIQTVTKKAGGTLVFRVGVNTAEESRKNTLILKAGKGEYRKTITQNGLKAFFQPRSLQLSGTAESAISFKAPSSWTAEITQGGEWFELKTPSGSAGNATLAAVAKDPNEAVGSREGSVCVTINGHRLEIPVVQGQKDVILSGDTDLSYSFEGRQFTVRTRYNVDYEISVPAKWIRRVTTKAPLYEKEETFLLEENEDPEARTGTISFTSSGHPDASLTVTVSQGGKDPILKNTKPGLYGLDGMNYVLGADGWNQNSRKKEADGSLRYRLLNAHSLSVATLSGIREEASCNLHALLQSRDKTLLDNDYPASLIYTKDGLGWFKVNDQTFFIINF